MGGVTVKKTKKKYITERKEIHSQFLISSQAFKCKLHVITRHPNLSKTRAPSIGWH